MTIGAAFPQVLRAAQAGGEWAWGRLYSDLAPTVLGYLRSRGAPDPEDLLGEVFLQVVRDVGAFSGDERDFRAWVLTVAHHRLLDDARYRGRRPVESVAEEALLAAAVRGDVEEEALLGLEMERLRRALEGLSADQQDVLMLRLFGELTIEEVARVVGKRPGAVKALQRRGLMALKRILSSLAVTL